MSDTDAMVDAAREAELKWLMETADLREQLRVAKEGLEKYADEFGDYWLYDGKEWGHQTQPGFTIAREALARLDASKKETAG